MLYICIPFGYNNKKGKQNMKRNNAYITEEFRKRMSEKLKGNLNALGHRIDLSQEARDKISAKLKGVKKSAETRQRMSSARTGTKASKETKKILSLAAIRRWHKPFEKLTYQQRHVRIRRLYGVSRLCENCGNDKAKYYDWANLSLDYKQERSDWKRLCRTCHGELDSTRRGHRRSNMSVKEKINTIVLKTKEAR